MRSLAPRLPLVCVMVASAIAPLSAGLTPSTALAAGPPAAIARSGDGPAGLHAAASLPPPADLDGDGIDDGLEQYLAETYAPVIYIHPYEANYPANVDWVLARAHLEYIEDCSGDAVEHVPGAPEPLVTQDALIGPPWAHPDSWGTGHPERHCGDPPDHRRITTIEPDPESYSDQTTFVLPDLADEDKKGSLDPSDWKSYVHVYPNSYGGVTVQFWHNFAYNGLDFLGFGNHGGDWDGTIHVELGPTLEPLGVIYSRHSNDHPGQFFDWDQVHKYRDTHPLMIIDRGGHAAFKDASDADDNGVPGTDYTWSEDADNPNILGTVWKTWTGGEVRQHDGDPFHLVYHITQNPARTGGIVNLGEYNPGLGWPTYLLYGEFRPLNQQNFLRYSGRWGSPGLIFSGPRGPVFQGYDGGVYKSWYYQAANAPAMAATHPWRGAPMSTLTVGTPTYGGGPTFVTGTTPFSLAATSNATAALYGSASMYYRFHLTGSTPPPFSVYSGPFALSGPDGAYEIEYYAVDGLNNVEDVHTSTFTLDATGPVTTIVQPAPTDYVHSSTLTLNYSTSDGSGSGVQVVTPTMDGFLTLAGHGLATGQEIAVLTELKLGTHTFVVGATDHLANAGSARVTFRIIVTPQSIIEDVRQLAEAGLISLRDGKPYLNDLGHALEDMNAGRCDKAINLYQSFINKILAQRGKKVDAVAADILIADATYLIESCGGAVKAAAVLPPKDLVASVIGTADGKLHAVALAPRGPVLAYELPSEGRVQVRVFDASGRLVGRVPDAFQSAGRHEVALADWITLRRAGVYFYGVEWGGRRVSGRFVVLP